MFFYLTLSSSEMLCPGPPFVVGTETRLQPAAVSPVQGYPQTLCGWMKEFPGSSEHNKAIQAAIETGPADLERGRSGVWISDHVDFGLKHAACETLFSDSRYVYLSFHVYCDVVAELCLMSCSVIALYAFFTFLVYMWILLLINVDLIPCIEGGCCCSRLDK